MRFIERKTIITLALILIFGLPALPIVVFSANTPAGLLESISGHEKLLKSESVLAPFYEGKAATRVIVTLDPPAEFNRALDMKKMDDRVRRRAEVDSFLEQVKSSLSSAIEITNEFHYQSGFSAGVTLEGLDELLNRDDVLLVEEDGLNTAQMAQGIPLMNAGSARVNHNGSGMAVAILDTGIDYMHSKLGSVTMPNEKVIGGYDTGDDDFDPVDNHGHGTACAGIIAGDLGITGWYEGGVAHNAKIYALKITQGGGDTALTSDIIEAYEWCITHQNDNPSYPIVIISTGFSGGRYDTVCDSAEAALYTAAAKVVSAGMTIFAPSGNDGFCTEMGRPACLSPVISVGAVYDMPFGTFYPCIHEDSCAPTKNETKTCTTGYEATDDTAADVVPSYSNTAKFLDLLAPAEQAYTTDIFGAGGYDPTDYYTEFGGTSAAGSYAAGAGAILQSWYKDNYGGWAAPDQLKSMMTSNGDSVTDPKTGVSYPRINVGNAIAVVGNLAPDICWQSAVSGRFGVETYRGKTLLDWNYISRYDVNWKIKAVGDFNGDGSLDLLWQNDSSGSFGWETYDGFSRLAWNYINRYAVDWKIRGVGDFNDDGDMDILWQNDSTGVFGWETYDGSTRLAWNRLGSYAVDWKIEGVGDFNDDGGLDILWRNDSTGVFGWETYNGTTMLAWNRLGRYAAAWKIGGTDDFNGDGNLDILWQNNSTGSFGWETYDGATRSAWNYLGRHTTDWNIGGVGPFQ